MDRNSRRSLAFAAAGVLRAADSAKATTVRGKEAEAYAQRKSDLETAIENLDRAIGVLGKLESDNLRDRASAAEETKLLAVAAGVRHALGLYTRLPAAKADVGDAVKSFFGNPNAFAAGLPPAVHRCK